MVFSSFDFVWVFLPITYLLFLIVNRMFPRANGALLLAASVIFYSYWSVLYLPLLLGSIAVNYALGFIIHRRGVLKLGVALNLALLFWFKYAAFVLGIFTSGDIASDILGNVIIPLGISFYTFQQISYLVDVKRGDAARSGPFTYAAYVSLFPQLIAGPIVRYASIEMQLKGMLRGVPTRRLIVLFSSGLFLFALGLFKKVVLADGLANWADPVFAQALVGPISQSDAILGTLAYTFQLYFDFSGYSDMALGLGRMFGLYLPMNFFSPYKSRSIADFWRRWHISLSFFVRDYIYIPLGGNRKGVARQALNLFFAFILIGIWHGAGWTFVVWGVAHALMVLVSTFNRRLPLLKAIPPLPMVMAVGVTFVCAALAWIPFRAETLDASWTILSSIFGSETEKTLFVAIGEERLGMIAVGLSALVAFFAPNALQWLGSRRHALLFGQAWPTGHYMKRDWRRRWLLPVMTALALYIALSSMELEPSSFIYFNF
ncbi:MBOAT family O-acyltransferase [uncultured Algimonas sp.]|uniref:MBOAT family O-acyltransferase n=1 Tax=uncultured Algimonas sp. TaxID=1547920 RepID=UPI0026105D89|nr:MBOAT family O-acyltransferase [uncultured Algimonas sp.]